MHTTYNLRTLDFSNNNISSIDPYTFRRMRNLQTLSLDHNDLKYLDQKAFYGLNNLNTLTLSHNPLRSISLDTFKYIPNLKNFQMRHTELNCSCSLRLLVETLIEKWSRSKINVTCWTNNTEVCILRVMIMAM